MCPRHFHSLQLLGSLFDLPDTQMCFSCNQELSRLWRLIVPKQPCHMTQRHGFKMSQDMLQRESEGNFWSPTCSNSTHLSSSFMYIIIYIHNDDIIFLYYIRLDCQLSGHQPDRYNLIFIYIWYIGIISIYLYIHSIWYIYMVYLYGRCVAASVMPTAPIHWSQWL